MRITSLLSLSGTVAIAAAQGAAWSQCGGNGWQGSTTCVAGYYCSVMNPYYSQCVPGTATTSSAKTTLTTSTRSSSATSSTKTTLATSKTSTASTPTGTTGISGFSKVSGNVFTINGKKTYFAGTNSYWIGFLTSNSDVDLVMTHLAATGLKVLRVWGFSDLTAAPYSGQVWFQSLIPGQSPVINTGADGLQRLDYVVESAAAHGISLIINFVNNWGDYGGMNAYRAYYNLSTTDESQWYLSTEAQAQYQKYIATVVARYKSNPAVFAWELANEPRCTGCSTSVITNWAKTTSAYIKSLDSNHMVTLGDEGFGLDTGSDGSYPYTYGPGTNWTANLAISTIDFGTFHLYPSSWGQVDSWGASWIASHAAAAKAVGKPAILEEYGASDKANIPAWQTAVLQNNIAGDLYWQYGDTFSWGQSNDDGHAIYYGTDLYTTLVTNHAAAMNAKAV
ncbi:fungal cellulose binding domain-containing protein [Phlyctema vagabunda]|uniref:mannan endo-1,4-beta-mannosidase n=1 Tax=Phlyctema vagabunda TaxID=108571 RepID=A0ABR4PQQ9_9HELO